MKKLCVEGLFLAAVMFFVSSPAAAKQLSYCKTETHVWRTETCVFNDGSAVVTDFYTDSFYVKRLTPKEWTKEQVRRKRVDEWAREQQRKAHEELCRAGVQVVTGCSDVK